MEALSIYIVSSIAYPPFLFQKCLTSLILFANYFMFLVVRCPLPEITGALVNFYLLHCSPYLAHCLALRIFSINDFDERKGSAAVPLLLAVRGSTVLLCVFPWPRCSVRSHCLTWFTCSWCYIRFCPHLPLNSPHRSGSTHLRANVIETLAKERTVLSPQMVPSP